MFLTIKPYLHLNYVLMLNWIIWNITAEHPFIAIAPRSILARNGNT